MNNTKKIELTDADKQLVLERYSDIEWCDDVTHMRCVSCQKVAIHHYVCNGNRIICRDCRTNRTPQGGKRYRKFHKTLAVPDVEIESKLCQLIVSCPNKKYGCQQVDQLGNIADHTRGCLSMHESTSLSMEQTETYTMDTLTCHMSGVSEQVRQMSDEMRAMKSESEANWKQTQSKITEMDLKEDNNMDQQTEYYSEAIKENLDLQKEKLTNYEVKRKGQDVKMLNNVIISDKKEDVVNNPTPSTHKKVTIRNTQLTLMEILVNNSIGKKFPFEYYEIISAERKRLRRYGEFGTLGQRHGHLICEFTWMVENFEEEIAKAKDNEQYYIESRPFYTNVPGYKCRLRLFPNDRKSNHVGLFLSLVRGEFDEIVPWPFNCKYKLYSVSRDGRRFASISVNPSTEINGQESFSRPSKTKTGYGSGKYVKSETLLANKDRYLTDGVLSVKATIWIKNTITLFHQWTRSRVERSCEQIF